MSTPARLLRGVLGLRRRPASALTLSGTMLLAPPAALLASAGAGDPPPPSMLALVVLLSLGFARAPDSGFGLLALVSVVAWWSLVADDGLHPSVLVAAVLLTAAHVAGLVAAYGPPGLAISPSIGAVWIARGAVVLLAAPVIWVLARIVRDNDPVAALFQAGLLVSVLAVVLAALALGGSRSDGRASG